MTQEAKQQFKSKTGIMLFLFSSFSATGKFKYLRKVLQLNSNE
jgi:hypothetical protein